MKYIIKNCDNCYCYDDEENIKDKYWCEFERDNTHFANPCYKSDCLLKQIVAKCKNYEESCEIEGNCLDKRLCSTCFLGGANELGEWILDDLEIEECEDD